MKPLLTEWRPCAHVAVRDDPCRARIIQTLRRRSWSVVEHPSGLHVIRALSGMILGDQPWVRPGMIVVDAAARGCRGITIARGLRDLDLRIPVVVIASPNDERPGPNERPITIVDPDTAHRTVELLTRAPARSSGERSELRATG